MWPRLGNGAPREWARLVLVHEDAYQNRGNPPHAAQCGRQAMQKKCTDLPLHIPSYLCILLNVFEVYLLVGFVFNRSECFLGINLSIFRE